MYKFKVIYDQFKEEIESGENLLIRKEFYVIDLRDFNNQVMEKAQENLQN
jgi:hypothetical protein